MNAYALDWLALLVRWFHFAAGISGSVRLFISSGSTTASRPRRKPPTRTTAWPANFGRCTAADSTTIRNI